MGKSIIYRLIVDSRETGKLKRKCQMRRQLYPWQAKLLNDCYRRVNLSDRWVKERNKKTTLTNAELNSGWKSGFQNTESMKGWTPGHPGY